MGKERLRKVKWLTQSHMLSLWKSKDWDLVYLTPKVWSPFYSSLAQKYHLNYETKLVFPTSSVSWLNSSTAQKYWHPVRKRSIVEGWVGKVRREFHSIQPTLLSIPFLLLTYLETWYNQGFMKTPQKYTAEFLRLRGCPGNNNFSLTRKLLGGTWLRDARNWSLYRNCLYEVYRNITIHLSHLNSQSISPYPNYSRCTNTGIWTSLTAIQFAEDHGSQPNSGSFRNLLQS